MKRLAKTLAVLCVAALAMGAVMASGASAAKFTASAAGSVTGVQTSNQVFKVNASKSEQITCKTAATAGTVEKESEEVHLTVTYGSCTAENIPIFGSLPAEVTKATYTFTSNNTVHIVEPIIIHIPALSCTITVPAQTVGTVGYATSGSGIAETSNVTGITSTSTGLCPNGTTGTYKGNSLVTRVGGGTLSFDP